MKKILHINTNMVWRGGEQQVHYIINHQSSQYQHFLFCRENSELYHRNKSITTTTFTMRFGIDITPVFSLLKICKKNEIDIIHVHDSKALTLYIFATFLGLKIPVVVHRRVNFPITNKYKYKHQQIKKIICLSDAVSKNFDNIVPKNKIVCIPPAIDINKYNGEKNNRLKEELQLNEQSKIIGIVAAIEKEKNIEGFIQIANLLLSSNDELHFVIIGDGSLFNEYQKKYSNNNIHFLGFRNNIAQLLSAFDVFVFSSINEGFGQILLEAMALGVPIVCNNFPVAKEIIQSGKNGFIYTSTQEAVEQINNILNNTNQQEEIIATSKKYVQQFDVTLINKKIEQVYQSILNNE